MAQGPFFRTICRNVNHGDRKADRSKKNRRAPFAPFFLGAFVSLFYSNRRALLNSHCASSIPLAVTEPPRLPLAVCSLDWRLGTTSSTVCGVSTAAAWWTARTIRVYAFGTGLIDRNCGTGTAARLDDTWRCFVCDPTRLTTRRQGHFPTPGNLLASPGSFLISCLNKKPPRTKIKMSPPWASSLGVAFFVFASHPG